jgi:hypothetical protein
MRGWSYSSTILDFDNGWSWVVRFTPLPLYSPHPLGYSRTMDLIYVYFTVTTVHCGESVGFTQHWILSQFYPRWGIRDYSTPRGSKASSAVECKFWITHYSPTKPVSSSGTCSILVSCLVYSSTLKVEAIYSSETSDDLNGLHSRMLRKI